MSKCLSLFYFLLENSDIFRFPLTLILNKKEKTSTCTGKIITIGLIIFLLSTFFLSDVINRKNPTTLSQDLTQASRPEILFSKENLTFAVGISNMNNTFLTDDSAFSFYFTVFYKNNSNQILKISSFKMHLCTNMDFLEDPSEFINLGLMGSYCLPTEPFKLKGYWDEMIIDYARIELKTCENSSESTTKCKTKEEINTFLEKTYVNFYVTNHNIDSSNYQTPVTRNLKMYYHQVEVKFMKTVTLFLKKAEIGTDDGLFFESVNTINTFVHGDLFLDFSEFNDQENIMHCIAFYSSDLETQVRRNYQRIQTLLAQLGGICNFIFLFGFMISKIENKFKMISTLSNELFIFPTLSSIKSRNNSNVQPLKSSVFQKLAKKKNKLPSDLSKENLCEQEVSKENNDKKKQSVANYFQLESKISTVNKRIASICGLKKINSNGDRKCPVIFDFKKVPIEKLENESFSSSQRNSFIIEKLDNASVSNKTQNSNIRTNPRFGQLKIDLAMAQKHSPWKERMKSFFKNRSEQDSPTLKKIEANEKVMVENIEHYQKLKQKENFFSVGFFGFIKLLFKNRKWCLNNKEKLFVKAEDQIEEELDVLKILKKLHDIDKLKRILLSDEQLYFFNLLSKPMIVLENKKSNREESLEIKDRRFKFSAKKNTYLNTERMMKLYTGMLQRSENSEVDRRIMKLLDEDVKCFLDHENCNK